MMSDDRSTRPEVRNPVLGLKAMTKLQALPAPARAALAELMLEIREDARERAQRSWRLNKAPMAAYWKSVSVYALHIYRALRQR